MLNSMRKGQRWLTLIFIILIGGVFVLFMGVGDGFRRGRPTGNAVIELGDIRIQTSDFFRLRNQNEENMRERVGDEFDATAMRAFLDAQTLRNLEDGVILADGAQELGLEVPTEEIKRIVQNSQAFRDESGRFVPAAFEAFANREYGGQRNFLEVMRQDLLRQKMMRVLYEQASVSPAELELAARYELEQVRLAFVALDTETLPGEPLSDEVVAAFLAEHEEEVRGVYSERADLYIRPEQVHARHILIEVDPDADEAAIEAARDEALALRARLLEGEDFAAVAQIESDDVGTLEDGGDLGFFTRGQNFAAFDEAAFSLQPGDLSEPIRTDKGFHLILVEERREAGSTPFEEVAMELARELATKAAAGERAQQTASALAEQIRAGESLEAAARGRLLTLERTDMLRRRPDGFVPGLGAAPEILAAAFALDADAPSSARVFTVDSQLVLIQLLERSTPDEDALADAILAAEQQLLDDKRNRMIQDWVDARREQLRASGELLVNTELVIANS
jgi:peptidyl-prolyl cis-trans isomerase D